MVQQIDIPANLYDYPSNAYVAFLVGSPSINFINDALIKSDGDEVVAEYNGGKLTLTAAVKQRFTALNDYLDKDKKVILGLRPEDISKADGEALFTGTVSAAEAIDGKTYADCLTEGKVSIVTELDGAKKGDEVKLTADLNRLYVFDADTRYNLLARDDGYIKTHFAEADRTPLPYGEEEEVKKKLKKIIADKKKKNSKQ
jgi:ABC-type sugar transport system ATPase subunit